MIQNVHPESGITIPDPGVKKAPDPGSGSFYNQAKMARKTLIPYVL
jgi:hypothetical protein